MGVSKLYMNERRDEEGECWCSGTKMKKKGQERSEEDLGTSLWVLDWV